jgi:hypothetical protein
MDNPFLACPRIIRRQNASFFRSRVAMPMTHASIHDGGMIHQPKPRLKMRFAGRIPNTRMVMEFYNQMTQANEQAAAATMDRLLAAEFHQSSTGSQNQGVA